MAYKSDGSVIGDLLEALDGIETRASCAPNDDPERAGVEFTRIMLDARNATSRAKSRLRDLGDFEPLSLDPERNARIRLGIQ